MGKHAIRSGIGILVMMSILPLTGCMIYSGDVSYGEKGRAPSESTLDQVECGKTTKDWVITTLGEPSGQGTAKNGVEVLEYRYTRKKDNNFVLLPFVFINDEGESRQTLYFEIRDDVVQNFWKETSKQ
jgi:outer membrane protein assembly factor BamE (lipoprotein component of BamABCDE complex)